MQIARIMVAALGADGVSSRMMSCRFRSRTTVVRLVASAMAFAAAAICTQATVQAQTRYNFKYSEALDAGAKIDPLGNDLFGDSISYADGGVEFSVVDVAAKTNHSLPVQFGRSMRPVRSDGGLAQYGRPDYSKEILGQGWIPDVPVISGVYPRNSEFAVGANRCTRGSMAPQPIPAYGQPPIFAFNFWHGTTVSIPGGGQHSILGVLPETPMPTDGKTYLYTAAGDWRIACLNSTKNNAGQGFEVLLPDGSRYYFDWVARAADVGLRIPVGGAVGVLGVDRDKFSIYATRAVDRFGNSVDYTYDPANPHRLLSIVSSDGAAISVAYGVDGRVSSVTNNGRVWTYTYTQEEGNPYIFRLSQVVLPDASKWTFEYINRMFGHNSEAGFWHVQCEYNAGTMTSQGNGPTGQFRAIHPSGAVGTFTFKTIVHGYNNVPFGGCYFDPSGQGTVQSGRPHATPLNSLISKKIEGPGLTPITWDIAYAPTWSWQSQCASGCPTTATTVVSRNDGVREEYVFGNDFFSNANQILTHKTYGGSQLLRSVSYAYAATSSGSYPQYKGRIGLGGAGDTPADSLDNPINRRNHPATSIVATQDGSNFVRTSTQFDVFARPIDGVSSGPSGARSFGVEFHDSLSLWVLGQRKKVHASGVLQEEVDFDWLSRPTAFKAYGKLSQSLTYNADGTVATVRDGNSNVVTLSNWKRGIPQSIKYPATAESPNGAIQSAVVNDSGWITSVTDENGYKTCYAYDAMGRLSRITYPSETATGVCDASAWNEEVFAFIPTTTQFGIPAGHWAQVHTRGAYRKITHFDALWRPIFVQEEGEPGTVRFTRQAYDHEGRTIFSSYPVASASNITELTQGIWTEYDALGRSRSVSQDSEQGLLTTTTNYLTNSSGPYTLVTTPAGQQTRTWFQMFDQPDYSKPVKITHPESASTHITRDIFGKPIQIRRSNSASPTGGTLAINRDYTYNAYQELCRSVEPETGATLMGYDGAGNLTWSASGLPTSTACHSTGNTTAINARKAVRTYDARNRITALSFPDGLGNTAHTYTPDGLSASITAYNAGNTVTTQYEYNRRRLLTQERMVWNSISWPLGYAYNANGHLMSQSYPDGASAVNFAPNALGQPTSVIDLAGNVYASGVSYYPNGAIKQFTYGNGIVHNMIQNARQLPERSYDCAIAGTDCTSTNKRQDLSYAYDAVGNVSGITDNRNGRQTRSMAYDGLDRLTQTISPMFGTASYTYNALDNLTSVGVSGGSRSRAHTYTYNAANQISNVKDASGASVVAIEYDSQGNLDLRTGQGTTHDYAFDFGNRLRSVAGKASYVYDGLGRRVRDYTTASKYSIYNQAGQLMYDNNLRDAKTTYYIHLAGSLLATREKNTTTGGVVSRFQHTDALGTPIAVTDAAKAIVETFEYEPYGQLVNSTLKDGPGFTGHVQDAATGLTYMQQRYYDPQVGLFLSVDPVTAYSSPVGQFHRYRYANNNPYKFADPDGRQAYFMTPPTLDREGGKMLVGTVADFTPVVSDVKAVAEAVRDPTLPNIASAGVGLVPVGGDLAAKGIKTADKLADARKGAEGARGTIFVDSKGNAIVTPPGGKIEGSPDGRFIQAKDADGQATGVRIDGGHRPSTHPDPRAQQPHGHVPGVNNSDGTPWLPLKEKE